MMAVTSELCLVDQPHVRPEKRIKQENDCNNTLVEYTIGEVGTTKNLQSRVTGTKVNLFIFS